MNNPYLLGLWQIDCNQFSEYFIINKVSLTNNLTRKSEIHSLTYVINLFISEKKSYTFIVKSNKVLKRFVIDPVTGFIALPIEPSQSSFKFNIQSNHKYKNNFLSPYPLQE